MIDGALSAAGGDLTSIVAARIYVTRVEEWEVVTGALRKRLGDTRPALTLVQVAGLLLPEHRVEIEVEAVLDTGPA